MKRVIVTVTSKIVGEAKVYPYERNMAVKLLPVYLVPLYEVAIDGARSFQAVRFGLTPLIMPPPHERMCNVGIFSGTTLRPTWVPGYSTHSFEHQGRPGAWRLFAGKQFLLHEGASNKDFGGSLGCIELSGAQQWNDFLSALQTEAGIADLEEVGRRGLLEVHIQPTAYPKATYWMTADLVHQNLFRQ